MQNKKIILKILFIFIIFILSVSIYGYGLVYEGEFIDPTNTQNTYRVKLLFMAKASEESTTEYNSRKQYDGQWLISKGNDANTTGTATSFGSFYYGFYPDKQPNNPTYIAPALTDYGSGFVSSGTNSNIYYDTSTSPITVNSDSFKTFSGKKGNVARNQDTTMDGFLKFYRTDETAVKHLQWRVTRSGVRLDLNELTNKTVQSLIKKYGQEKLENGVRFGNGLRTKYDKFAPSIASNKDNMDTAWLFFQLTTGYWYSGVRGFKELDIWTSYGSGTYNKGASVANEYDNILTLPFKNIQASRKVYINHVDINGNVVSGLKKSSQQYVENGVIKTISNEGSSSGYQETYTINANQQIRVTESTSLTIGSNEYTFKYGKSALGATLSEANNNLKSVLQTWRTPKQFANSSKSDVLVINLIYDLVPPPPSLARLQLVGRLEFINTDSSYINSTSSHDLDYIPSTKSLTPYAQGAYPYIVRGLRYETRTMTSSASTSVTANIVFSYDVWTYSHGTALQIDKPAVPASKGPPPTPYIPPTYKHKHDATCDWYKSTYTSSTSKSFGYTVPYKHTWFEITNFKMYRISKLETYDDESNIGGTLFGGGTYLVSPSGTYESRFNNSRGIVRTTLSVSFPSRSYSLPSVYVSKSKPSGGTETPSGTSVSSYSSALQSATSRLSLETNKSASDATSLTISYGYDNDYVELDGMTNMLAQNYKTWSERIDKATDAGNVRNLDSTRAGTGSSNGSVISYTSNLMSYMKPTTRLTTNSDFTDLYQTVPVNRENGIRQLDGKILYTVNTNPKYNVGSDTFTATDSTYSLNTPASVVPLDLTDQTKVYKGDDVNKVNVLTPINFGSFELITAKIVDHSAGAGSSTILQRNAEFTITPVTNASTTAGYSLSDTREFVKGYYFIFDFDVIYNGETIDAYDTIYIEGKNASITAKTTDTFSGGLTSQISNSIKIVAVTTNLTDALKSYFDAATYSNYSYMDSGNNVVRNTQIQNQKNLLTRTDIINDSYHGIYRIITTKNIGRIFDFAVTDCTDIAFKDVFRKSGAGNINEPTGVSYYAGYKQLNIYSTQYNEMINRSNIGTSPQTILPLGPYKNTNTRYLNAPKMGYRISFDLKTTGYIDNNNINNSRTIQITPRYYYISKDGKTFDNNIKLYYKNTSGNYINFESSGYTIYYKPNDGYRYLRNSMYTDNNSFLSTKLEPIVVSNTLVLTNKMMSTNNNSFIQAWYGEYKLPNSTIAVSNIPGNVYNNINNPYKDGYIGVIFDIKCIDISGFILSYDTNDKSANPQTNTSQWDYEGYMNFNPPGSNAGLLKYQLDRGVWEIDNTRYEQIKGTVVLFDLDNRAANDFE
jgi:hypothetical protein